MTRRRSTAETDNVNGGTIGDIVATGNTVAVLVHVSEFRDISQPSLNLFEPLEHFNLKNVAALSQFTQSCIQFHIA